MSKGDLYQAFRVIRVSVNHIRLLGFTWNGLIYVDLMLPMGAAVLCAQFEILSRAIQWILINVFKVPYMSHILDDFLLFGHPGTSKCLKGIQSCISQKE